MKILNWLLRDENRPRKSRSFGLEAMEQRVLLSAAPIISEVHPGGSGNGTYAADWFEVTNTGTTSLDITGWKMDDNSNAFASAVSLRGVTNIPAGKSAVFFEGTATGTTDATITAAFSTAWFGSATPPADFLIGAYGGTGVGLSTTADAVNLFDSAGVLEANVTFGAATAGKTFDNAAGLNNAAISQVSAVGVNGAFLSANGAETGSPGTIGSHGVTSVDLSAYTRVGRFDLPEPTRTTPPDSTSLLAQEASSVTYDWDTDSLFVVGDGGTSVVQVSKTGQLINSMTLAPGSSPQGTTFYDTEGITYVGSGKFVMTEERDRQLVEFTYVAGATLNRADALTVKLGTTIGNIGLEGVTWDPSTGEFIVVKEKDPRSIFLTGVDFAAGTATNGSPTTVESTDLFDPALVHTLDFSDVYALSNLPSLNGTSMYDQLLIISQESGQIVQVDRTGTVHHTLTIVADAGSPISVPDMTMEGVTMDRDGFLYVVNENGGGDANHPQLWVYAPSTVANQAPTAVSLSGAATSIPENTNTAADVKLADILVTDDGLGDNNLSVAGADAGSFKIVGTALFLKAGTTLNAATKPSYRINVNVDDATVGGPVDASTPYTLTITPSGSGVINLAITEAAPWSSGNSPATLAADWFEATNFGASAVSLVGWTMDDNSNSFSVSVPLNGITSIKPGESVIFIETATSGDMAAKATAFINLWFGGTAPAGLQIGSYSGSGVGLSTGGDAVNLFDNAGIVRASISFPAVAAGSTFFTFDNTAGVNNAVISNLSSVGVFGAFAAINDANEIGSPGTIGSGATPIINITAPDASASETGSDPGVFHITRSGSTVSPLTVNYTIATGAGQATSSDYTPVLTGSMIIAAGDSSVDITITPVDDALVEGAETLTLTLFDTGSYDVGPNASATVTIADNDAANHAPTAVTLINATPAISDATSTASAVRVADISITDDGLGTNSLSLTGADAASFQITGSSLFLKAGTVLSHATKAAYNVTVNVDDTTVGGMPDASTNFTLTITQAVAPGTIVISEVAPWSSANSPIAVDWFEVTNTGNTPVDITGWKMDDNSHAIGTAVALNGVGSIAPGEAVIFMETADLTTKAADFRTLWFGSNAPAGLQIGSYSGSGVGLSSSGDEVTLFDAAGNMVTGVGFTTAPAAAPFATFDNHNGVGGTTVPLPSFSTLSAVGTNGAFAAANDATEIGSPGIGNVGRLIISEVAPWASSNSPYMADWFEVTNVGTAAVNITGWKMDDNSNSFASSVALRGVTTIGPGKSAVFIEGLADGSTDSTIIAAFSNAWFGSPTLPDGFLMGAYGGSGVGLSTTTDAVNLFDGAGNRITGVSFGASTTGISFDNAAGLGSATLPLPAVSKLTVAGTHGAFIAADGTETGSPGTIIPDVAPIALPDTVATAEDTAATFNVLGNDTDADGDIVKILSFTQTGHGTVTGTANGNMTYTPAANFNGSDSFTYTISDGKGGTATATVSIAISAVNDAPVAVGESLTTNEDVPLTVVGAGVLTNDTDAENNPLTAVLVSGTSHGTLTLNANGSFVYTPAANFNETDSFTYKANDGTADSNVATVTITVKAVNDAPVAKNDHYSIDKHTTLTVAGKGVLTNDSDVDSTTLTAILVTGTSHGKLKLNADGSFTYTPEASFRGTDTFTYRVSDGTLTSNLATVTITVGEKHHCHDHCECGRHRHHNEHDDHDDDRHDERDHDRHEM
jgi:VCBS repeat-containing protein